MQAAVLIVWSPGLRFQEQVKVIVHEHEGMNPTAEARSQLRQQFEKLISSYGQGPDDPESRFRASRERCIDQAWSIKVIYTRPSFTDWFAQPAPVATGP
jgi:hypothetical protein